MAYQHSLEQLQLIGKAWRKVSGGLMVIRSWDDWRNCGLIMPNEETMNRCLPSFYQDPSKKKDYFNVADLRLWVKEFEEAPKTREEEAIIPKYTQKQMETAIEEVLTAWGPKGLKINCIKAVRAITGLGLKEAKDIVDRAFTEKVLDLHHHFTEGNIYNSPDRPKERFIVRQVQKDSLDVLWITDMNGKALAQSHAFSYTVHALRSLGFILEPK